MRLLTLSLLLLLSLEGISQQRIITGKLIDSISNEPVRNATLYINQTQITTLSDANGRFKINLPQSPSELLITHVAYDKRAVVVQYTTDTFLIRLYPNKGMMEEVTVSARINNANDWKKWGALFTEYFIGPGMEKKCVLLNPEVIRFRYDKEQMILKAWARRPLLIENRMLGYTIHVDLDSFIYSSRNTSFAYFLSDYFEPLKGREGAERTLAANRLRAYGGSRMHFMRSVFSNTLAQEGFNVYKYVGQENANKKRVQELVMKAQMQQGSNRPVFAAGLKDSAKYYNSVMTEPSYLFRDSLPVNINERRTPATGNLIHFYLGRDTLLLEYQPAVNNAASNRQLKRWANLKEPDLYFNDVYNFLQQPHPQNRYSLLYLIDRDSVNIQESGMTTNPGSLLSMGLFAQRRMAYELPWDYDPAKDYQQLASEGTDMYVVNKINNGLEKIARQHSPTELYLHVDKTTYDPLENIWFAAYVLRSPREMKQHHTLYVFLQNKATGKKAASQQFVMEDGRGAGYIFVADSLAGGNYKLVAYTNTYPFEENAVVFEQDITVRPYANAGAKNQNAKPPAKTTVLQKSANIKWYPEGGDLVDGLPCRLMLQVRDQDQKPLALAGNLLENGKLIAPFTTDATGVGLIEFTPATNKQYSVQLKDTLTLLNEPFPAVLREGYSIRVPDGVIKDSLQFTISSNTSRPAHVLVHNYKTNYFLEELELKNKEETITISADDIPGGLTTITVFNEKGMPVAERTVFKHAGAQPVLSIEVDSTSYRNRSKVVAKIRSTDAAGNPVQSVFSLAGVMRRRVDTTKLHDIVSYSYLIPYKSAGLLTDNPYRIPAAKKYLEQFLLVQCWTRYGWQSLEATTKPAAQHFTLIQQGKVLYNGTRIKGPVDVIVFRQSGFTSIKTDNRGNFIVPPEVMASEADWRLNFAVDDERKQGYKIVFENDNDLLQEKLASVQRPSPLPVVYPQDEPLLSRMLAPVVVKATIRNDDPFNDDPIENRHQGTLCKDYVCMYNILNCGNHPYNGRKPQRGYSYYMMKSGMMYQVLYDGCTTGKVAGAPEDNKIIFQLNGRYYNKEFYVADYAKDNPVMPEEFTTLYWNPLIVTDSNGETTVSFYTNDLSGAVLLMAQGIFNDGVLSGKKVFGVR